MKAFQIHAYENHCGYDIRTLIATYFDRDRAEAHAREIISTIELDGDKLIEEEWKDGAKYWLAHGWSWTTLARIEEIEII